MGPTFLYFNIHAAWLLFRAPGWMPHAAYFQPSRAIYWITTFAVAPFTNVGCIPGSRIPPFEIARFDCPDAFAIKVTVTTGPAPEIPVAPGGRVAVICRVPVVSSSRCTSATA